MKFPNLILAAALALSLPLSAATVQTIKRDFDLHGNLAKETRNDGGWTEYTHTPDGLVKTRTDDLGRLSVFEYDALKRMITRTDTANGVTRIQRFDYDGRNRLTKYTDPRGLVTTYTYNGFDEVIVQTSPDSGVTTTVPNGKGGTDTVTDAKRQTTKYRYDTAGRLNTASGWVTVSDNDTGESISARAFTGGDTSGRPWHKRSWWKEKPAPPGQYYLTENPGPSKATHPDWYGVLKKDGRVDDQFDDGGMSLRDGVRFHLGATSYGCVTVDKNVPGQDQVWKEITNLIGRTKKGTTAYHHGYFYDGSTKDIPLFGTVIIR